MRPRNSPLTTAVRLLAARSLSRRELTDALLRRHYSADEVREAVETCTERGYINESHYAYMLVQKYAGQGYGIPAVAAKLRTKGFSNDIVDEALTHFSVSESVLDKYALKALKGDFSPVSQRRACQSLLRRGFSYSDVRAALERVIADTDSPFQDTDEYDPSAEDEYELSFDAESSFEDTEQTEDTMESSDEETDVPNGAEYV